MKTLAQINKEYEEITYSDLKEPIRSRRLADLMEEMEQEYKVPMIRSEAWEIQNKAVIALYRKISMSRSRDL
jgi:hypothetical protein